MSDELNFKVIERHNSDLTEEFAELYEKGLTAKKIKEKLDIGGYSYYRYLKKYKKMNNLDDDNDYIKCAFCGKIFFKKHHNSKYCSKECRVESNKRIVKHNRMLKLKKKENEFKKFVLENKV